MYYAMSDRFTGDTPVDYTAGFANTKEPVAFQTREARQRWLSTTRLTTSRPLSYRDALKFATTATGNETVQRGTVCQGAKLVRVAFTENYHVIKHSNM